MDQSDSLFRDLVFRNQRQLPGFCIELKLKYLGHRSYGPALSGVVNKRGVKFCLLREKDEVEPDRVSKHRVGLRGRGVEMLRRLCLEP